VQYVPVRIVVAQFEDLLARGLRELVEDSENLDLVADGVPHADLARVIAEYQPDVAILNYGSLGSPSELRELARLVPDTRLLVLADRPKSAECRQMLAFGATACLAKSAQARDLLHAIHLASRGLHVLPPIAHTASDAEQRDSLTPREADVLELLQIGRSNAEIALALGISVETVRTHVRRIYRKLGVTTRRELLVRT
jgi:DNA-binding NarL/FixJ family response regulator